MFLFKTRQQAREFAKRNSKYKVVDCKDRYRLRWGVKVL